MSKIKKENYVICCSKVWNDRIIDILSDHFKSARFILLTKKEDLSFSLLHELNPKYVFFPHWSYIIPSDIYTNFTCIIFHMTDLPYGRGGSPLQNLIVRGHRETKISALKCVSELDAGPIYKKTALSLIGTAKEIYQRATSEIISLIKEIIIENPVPVPQVGEVITFKRRTPTDGNLSEISNLNVVYDFIRMLDAEGYPNAFLTNSKNIKFEFFDAKFEDANYLTAQVRIRINE